MVGVRDIPSGNASPPVPKQAVNVSECQSCGNEVRTFGFKPSFPDPTVVVVAPRD